MNHEFTSTRFDEQRVARFLAKHKWDHILLVRHGPSKNLEYPYNLGTHYNAIAHRLSPEQRGLLQNGKKYEALLAVADRLGGYICENSKFKITLLLHGEHKVVRDTARIYYDIIRGVQSFNSVRCIPWKWLDPSDTYDFEPTRYFWIANSIDKGHRHQNSIRQLFDMIRSKLANLGVLKWLLKKYDTEQPCYRVLMLVGHQPMLSWIAHELTGDSLAIPRSSVACLRFERSRMRLNVQPPIKSKFFHDIQQWIQVKSPIALKRWKLEWLIEPSDKDAMNLLREKIKSKMDLAKTLGSFITAILAIIFGFVIQSDKIDELSNTQQAFLFTSLLVFSLSAGLFFSTLYAYDALLMPVHFWGEKPGRYRPNDWLVKRPPSSSLLILQQNMYRIWNRFFVPATYLVFVGVYLLGITTFLESEAISQDAMWLSPVFFGAYVIYRYIRNRPRLGTDD